MYVLQVSADPAVTAVPEPGPGALWIVGLLGLVARLRQRRAPTVRG
jgi:MYXO-CTERM domain-containing protein